MSKKPTLLERMQSAGIDNWLDHQSGRTQTSLDDILNPSQAYWTRCERRLAGFFAENRGR